MDQSSLGMRTGNQNIADLQHDPGQNYAAVVRCEVAFVCNEHCFVFENMLMQIFQTGRQSGCHRLLLLLYHWWLLTDGRNIHIR